MTGLQLAAVAGLLVAAGLVGVLWWAIPGTPALGATLDHLAGGEDYTPEQRRRMLQRERRWVLKAKALGLLAGLRAG